MASKITHTTMERIMSGNAKQPPSFFKILTTEDFAHLLRLPDALLQKYGSIFPKKVKLRGESGRRSWMVEVKAMENGLICFSRGWNTFAKDVGLKPMEALEFVVADDAKALDVTLFGVDGCQRQFPPHAEDEGEDEDHVEDEDEDKDDEDVFVTRGKPRPKPRKDWAVTSWKKDSPLYFEIDLKEHHRSRVTLKKEFSVAAGLIGDNTVEIIGERYTDCIGLDHRGGTRVDIMAGWREFRKKNALTYGKTYSFEFKPAKNAIYVSVTEVVKKSN